jgi:hypothetical protein
MKITYIYFGIPVPALTFEKEEIELPTDATIHTLMGVLCEEIDESFSRMLQRATFLVNKIRAKGDGKQLSDI